LEIRRDRWATEKRYGKPASEFCRSRTATFGGGILRELEGLSYKQIAAVAEISVGTVMSRLARARKRLQQILKSQVNKETREEVMVGGS
jgi:transposase